MVKVKINERQILHTIKKLAQAEFEEKKPKRVEIRRVKTLAIFQEKVRSIMDWVKYLSRYILVVYYPTSIRVYFLTKTGHMQAAMDFRIDEFKEIENLLKRKTKLIYAIKEITPHIPNLEELAQFMLEKVNKYLKSASERTGASKKIIPIIKIIEENPEKLGPFGCRLEGNTIFIAKKMCEDPLSNYTAQYISYLIMIPKKHLVENLLLAEDIASSVLKVYLTGSEVEEFFKFSRENCRCLNLNKKGIKILYKYLELVEQYEMTFVKDDIYLQSFEYLLKEKNVYLGLVKLFEALYNEIGDNVFLLKSVLSYYLTGLYGKAKEVINTVSEKNSIDYKVISNLLGYKIGFIYSNKNKVNHNLTKILEDALELCLSTAIDVKTEKILSPSEDTNNLLLLQLKIRNKTDLDCFNVKILVGKWIPRSALQLKKTPSKIVQLEHEKETAVIIGFQVLRRVDVKILNILAIGRCINEIRISGQISDIKINKILLANQ